METLAQVLKERGLEPGEYGVSGAGQTTDVDEELEWWVGEYLTSDTLLSKDEVSLHEHLSRTRAHRPSGRPGGAVTDADVLRAIESLEASTAAIEGHRSVLESQRAALSRLWERSQPSPPDAMPSSFSSGSALPTSSSSRGQSLGEVASELGGLKVAAEESTELLGGDLATARIVVEDTVGALATYVAERLESDDAVLEKIAKARRERAPAVTTADPSAAVGPPAGAKVEVKAVERWCESLVAYRAAEVKARVHTVEKSRLLEAAPFSSSSLGNGKADGGNANRDAKAALRAELDGLQDEVEAVAVMVVNHQLRTPITKALERSARESQRSTRAWHDHVVSSLQYMAARLDALADCAEELFSFHAAAAEIRAACNAHQNATAPSAASRPARSGTPNSRPRLRAALSDRQGSAHSPRGSIRPLLRALDLDLSPGGNDDNNGNSNSGNNGTGNSSGRALSPTRESLAETALLRQARAEAQRAAAERADRDLLGEFARGLDGDAAAALAAVYAHSEFGTKALEDAGLKARVEGLERAVDEVGREIEGVERRQREGAPGGVAVVVKRWG